MSDLNPDRFRSTEILVTEVSAVFFFYIWIYFILNFTLETLIYFSFLYIWTPVVIDSSVYSEDNNCNVKLFFPFAVWIMWNKIEMPILGFENLFLECNAIINFICIHRNIYCVNRNITLWCQLCFCHNITQILFWIL